MLVVDGGRTVRGRGYREFAQIYPRPGEVEHDPEAIWGSVTGALKDALAGVDVKRIAALGITNQRETTLLWERAAGTAGGQRHRLAGPADGAVLCRAQGGGERADGARADRTGPRSLFFGHQDSLAARRGRRSSHTGRGGRDRLRDRRQLPHLAADGRQDARHGCHQRLAHAALRSAHAAVLRRALRAVWCPARALARGLPVGGATRRDARRAGSPRRYPDHRRGGRPAGRALRPGLHRSRATRSAPSGRAPFCS